MSICTVDPGLLLGRLIVPPSKSMAHRALLCAAMAGGESVLDNFCLSDDMLATMGALRALGVRSSVQDSHRFPGRKQVTVFGTDALNPTGEVVDCIESGSTARFIIPFSRLTSGTVTVTGRNGLLTRPFGVFHDLFHGKGVKMADQNGCLPVTLTGRLLPGTFRLPGNVSSQFITGLLFILPQLESDSVIEITGPLESAPYVAMTLEMLEIFGVRVDWVPVLPLPTSRQEVSLRIHVPGGQQAQPVRHDVEGDWSQAAFWVIAGAVGGSLTLSGLRKDSLQGDKVVLDLLGRMGADIQWGGDWLHITNARGRLDAIDMDVSQCPDLVPALSVAAACATGVTRIGNAARLRIKESDRLTAMRMQLESLGGQVVEEPDALIIEGLGTERFGQLKGGQVDGCNDHRIVMACAIAAARSDTAIVIKGAEAVRKSYPGFWDDFEEMGGIRHG